MQRDAHGNLKLSGGKVNPRNHLRHDGTGIGVPYSLGEGNSRLFHLVPNIWRSRDGRTFFDNLELKDLIGWGEASTMITVSDVGCKPEQNKQCTPMMMTVKLTFW